MNINFLGAAQTVTGSCYVIQAAGARFCVDCGMHQGNNAIEKRNNETGLYQAGNIDFVLLTHAHIDHSGLLPLLVKTGFKGPIFCTSPTAALVSLMLEDSAHIQEMEFEWKKQHEKRKGKRSEAKSEALYTMADAQKAASQTKGLDFGVSFEPHPGIKVTFRYASHILGAAFLDLEITEDGKITRLIFSGDLGRPGALLLNDPEASRPVDYLFLESTYGDRNHKGESDTLKELAEAVTYSYGHRQKVIIPTFAVERAQELLFTLMMLHDENKIPADMPIYVDSPLAIKATEVFLKYSDKLNSKGSLRLGDLTNPKYNIHYTLSADESRALNEMKGPAIILSASGMCNAGRIKHHIKHNIWQEGASIVFVGYQAIGTPGRQIVDGAKTVRPFGVDITVAAKIFTINGFSAHAGQDQLLSWLEDAVHPNLHIVLIHGEEKAQQTLAGLIRQRFRPNGKELAISIPGYLDEMTLLSGQAPQKISHTDQATPSVDWIFWQEELQHRLQQVQKRLGDAPTMPWERQTDMRDRLKEISAQLTAFLSDV